MMLPRHCISLVVSEVNGHVFSLEFPQGVGCLQIYWFKFLDRSPSYFIYEAGTLGRWT